MRHFDTVSSRREENHISVGVKVLYDYVGETDDRGDEVPEGPSPRGQRFPFVIAFSPDFRPLAASSASTANAKRPQIASQAAQKLYGHHNAR